MTAFKRAVTAMGVLLLGGCAMDIDDFRDRAPSFSLERYFSRPVQGSGIEVNRFGEKRKQFTVEADGTWNEGLQLLMLRERYAFDDGRVELLEWVIHKEG